MGQQLQCGGPPGNGSAGFPGDVSGPFGTGIDPVPWVTRGDYTVPPDLGWIWRTASDAPEGSPEGAWWNPETEEYLRNDPFEIKFGPHVDYRDPDRAEWRIFPDGRVEPK